ncbi:hypothetical protein KM043_007353 [Ampulex compressa]|nr:hypothetical protein KM043_007353 [Ampulex compressa]
MQTGGSFTTYGRRNVARYAKEIEARYAREGDGRIGVGSADAEARRARAMAKRSGVPRGVIRDLANPGTIASAGRARGIRRRDPPIGERKGSRRRGLPRPLHLRPLHDRPSSALAALSSRLIDAAFVQRLVKATQIRYEITEYDEDVFVSRISRRVIIVLFEPWFWRSSSPERGRS